MKFGWVVTILFTWGIPAILLFFTWMPEYQGEARRITLKNLKDIHSAIKAYKDRYGTKSYTPSPPLRLVAEYARSNIVESPIEIYDRYGAKFFIHYLDTTHVIVRSLGWTSEYRNIDEDHPYFRGLFAADKEWDKLFSMIIHNYPKPPALYQPAQLESSASGNKKYIARLFVYDGYDIYNQPVQHRTLVIVKKYKQLKDPIFISTPSIQPEEFIWFPSTKHQHLIFTSTPSTQKNSRGPLHIFDAKNREIKTVTIDQKAAIDHTQSSKKTSYLAALAGAEEDKLYVYLLPYVDKEPISSETLFHVDNLYQIHITFPHNQLRAIAGKVITKSNFALRREYSSPREGEGTELQKLWFDLKIIGNIEQNIHTWQEFATHASEEHSPIFPYACVTLISLYEKAARAPHIDASSNNWVLYYSEAIKTAKKYAKFVYGKPIHPLWLRMVGWESWIRLQEGRPLNIEAITPKSRERRN